MLPTTPHWSAGALLYLPHSATNDGNAAKLGRDTLPNLHMSLRNATERDSGDCAPAFVEQDQGPPPICGSAIRRGALRLRFPRPRTYHCLLTSSHQLPSPATTTRLACPTLYIETPPVSPLSQTLTSPCSPPLSVICRRRFTTPIATTSLATPPPRLAPD